MCGENMSMTLEEKNEVMPQGGEHVQLDGSWLYKTEPQFVRYLLAYGEIYHHKERRGKNTYQCVLIVWARGRSSSIHDTSWEKWIESKPTTLWILKA